MKGNTNECQAKPVEMLFQQFFCTGRKERIRSFITLFHTRNLTQVSAVQPQKLLTAYCGCLG